MEPSPVINRPAGRGPLIATLTALTALVALASCTGFPPRVESPPPPPPPPVGTSDAKAVISGADCEVTPAIIEVDRRGTIEFQNQTNGLVRLRFTPFDSEDLDKPIEIPSGESLAVLVSGSLSGTFHYYVVGTHCQASARPDPPKILIRQ